MSACLSVSFSFSQLAGYWLASIRRRKETGSDFEQLNLSVQKRKEKMKYLQHAPSENRQTDTHTAYIVCWSASFIKSVVRMQGRKLGGSDFEQLNQSKEIFGRKGQFFFVFV